MKCGDYMGDYKRSISQGGKMKNEKPLISILVLCYNNQQYIYENLQSIFTQTYPNLEVLISDDASDSFDAERLVSWINANRTKNIKKISIYENPYNIGTVASLENLQVHSSGTFLFNIAADDTLYDPHVIEKFYEKAMELGGDGEWIISQTEMWDNALKKKLGDFLAPESITFIQESTPKQIFAECSWHPYLPASYFYHRSFMDRIGTLSNKYKLIEDWPTQLIATRQGIRPYYLDIQSSIKHRDGGISHGNSLHSKKVLLRFYEDMLSVYSNEVQPYDYLLNSEDRERAAKYYKDRVHAFGSIHLPDYRRAVREEQKKSIKSPMLTKPSINTHDPVTVRAAIKALLCWCSSIDIIMSTFCCFIFLLGMSLISMNFSGILSELICSALHLLTIVGAILLQFEIASYALLKIRKAYHSRKS